MPERRAVLQLGLLLMAVPAQYFVSRWYATSVGQRSTALKEFMTVAAGFQEKYLSWRSWRVWCMEMLDDVKLRYSNQPYKQSVDPRGETPAVEVFNYKEPNGYFTRSTAVRSPRPDNVQFHVGQVVRHKGRGYRGVIIGWDSTPKAPLDWLRNSYPHHDLKVLESLPFYAILVDTRDNIQPHIVYVPQDLIARVVRFQVQHPQLYDYIDYYEGMRYVPRPWLRVLYPHD